MSRKSVLILFGCIVVTSSLSLKSRPRKSNVNDRSSEHSHDYNVCDNQECEDVAKLIINGMNKTINPCDDFYSYVCGSWPINYPVPVDQFKWDLDGMVERQIQAFLKQIVQKRPRSDDSVPLTLEKKWFAACMNEERIEEKGLEPLTNIIEKIGGWPMAMSKNAWMKKGVPWQKVVQYYASIVGSYSLFTIGIQPDAANSSVQIISIDQPSDSLIEKRSLGEKENGIRLRRYYDTDYDDNDSDEDEEGEFGYARLMMNIASSYASITGGSPVNIILDTIRMLQFEVALDEIKTPPEEKVDIDLGNNKMTISEFQKYYNSKRPGRTIGRIDWLEMIQIPFMNSGVEIDSSEEIAILDKSYIQKLIHLLKKTPQRTIVNYIHWTFVSEVLKYLDNTTKQLYSETVNAVFGIKQETERWKDCLENMPISDGLSYEFVKNHFSDMTKETATKMAEEIRKEIDFEISRTSWMNSETKQKSSNKLKAMNVLIGYPDWYKNRVDFNSYYDGLEVGPDYFQNVLNYIKFVTQNTVKDFRNPFDKEEWFMKPITSNAYYLPPSNSLTVPAAQLLIPIFNSKVPASLNYGSIGFIIGHEMSHGFDITGRRYDEGGNAIPWWSEQMINQYDKKADCFVEQFNEYEVDGKVTEGENIADTAGLNAAFGAYKKQIKKEDRDLRLPGLEDLRGNQLFFISFGTAFCQSATPQFLEKNFNDVHTKAAVRINGAVTNVDGFSEAFKCTKNSPLNKGDKCVLWQ